MNEGLAITNGGFPLVRALPRSMSAAEVFSHLAAKPYCLFLDSSLRHRELGVYSYVMADPYDVVVLSGEGHGLEPLQRRLENLRSTRIDGLPPFQGGVAGVLGYEFGHQFESYGLPRHNEFEWPQAVVGCYDVVIAFDHRKDTGWIISQGFPELAEATRAERAGRRLEQFEQWLQSPPETGAAFCQRADGPIDIDSRMEQVGAAPAIFSNFSRNGYEHAVSQAVEYIRAGDVFQVNLSQRLLTRETEPPVLLYHKLRSRTPSTFSGYFDAGDWQVMSASPERFVRASDGRVETRPIKGTRPQRQRPVEDVFASGELVSSEKDRAENTMIVDLLRNDLSRVCLPDSVHVPQWCGLESYGYVSHLVSVVTGTLNSDATALDVLAAAFPGGSITGAPKIRAMEIISELEEVARGPYCGSMGYIGWDGSMDFNILIRTIMSAGGWWSFPAGGGIVEQSVPHAEYDETWDKARGVLAAMT